MPSNRSVETLVADAIADIDPKLLTGTGTGGLFSTGYFHDGPLIDKLKPGEQPEYAFSNKKRGIEIQWANSTEQVVPGSDYRSAILATDERILCVFGNRTGDRVVEIPYHLITSTSVSTGVRRDKISLEGDNVTYNLYTPKRSGASAAASFIRNQAADARKSRESSTTTAASSSNSSASSTSASTSTSTTDTPIKSTSSATTSQDSESASTATTSGGESESTSSSTTAASEPDDSQADADPQSVAEEPPDPSDVDPRSREAYVEKSLERRERAAAAQQTSVADDGDAHDGDTHDGDTHEGDAHDGDAQDDESEDAETDPVDSVAADDTEGDDEDSESPSPPETEPPLPAPSRVRGYDAAAADAVASAAEFLQVDDEVDRDDRVRAHSELCLALEALSSTQGATSDGDPSTANTDADGLATVIEELEAATTELEAGLAVDDPDGEAGAGASEAPAVEFCVRDEADSPIPGATITLNENDVQRSVETDADGRCQVTLPEHVDSVDAIVAHPDHVTLNITVANEHGHVIDIQLAASQMTDDTRKTDARSPDVVEASTGTSDNTSESVQESTGASDESTDSTSDGSRRRELLDELRALDENWSEIDRVLLHSVSDYHPDAFDEAFGGLQSAREAAGIVDGVDPEATDATEPETDDASRDVDERGEADDVSNTLDEAIEAAGILSDDVEDTKTTEDSSDDSSGEDDESPASHRDRLLAELNRLDKEWSKDIDRRLLYSVGEYDPQDYEDEFGSLFRALQFAETFEQGETVVQDAEKDASASSATESEEKEASDADPAKGDDVNGEHRTALLAELKRLDDDWSKDVDRRLLYSLGEYEPQDYEDEFGSLDAALAAAGLGGEDDTESTAQDSSTANSSSGGSRSTTTTGSGSSPENSGYAKSEVLAEIRRLTEKLGSTPTVSEMQEHGEMSPTPAYRYWNSWADALDAAGVTASTSDDSNTRRETKTGYKNDSKAAATGDGLEPNELAELYDIFGTFEDVLEGVVHELDAAFGSPQAQWYEAVYDYWGGTGRENADCLGAQQSHRNDFSINEYRTQYGTGTRVRDFHEHEVRPIDQSVKRRLESEGVSFDIARTLAPVAPDSTTKLPVVVETQAELADAKALLAEFPAHPGADHAPPTSEEGSDSIPPEGRLDSYTVRVLSQEPNPGSHRDTELEVETEAGDVLRFDIWSKHDIDFDWTTGDEYELKQVRHKVWNSNGNVYRALSSTRDLKIAGHDGRDGGSDGGDPGDSGGSDGDGGSGDDGDDIVDTIMDDIDLEGSS